MSATGILLPASWWGTELVVYPAAGGDTTPPTTNVVTGASGGIISRVTGKDDFAFSFTVNEAVQAWQLKLVPASNSPQTAGSLIESGGSVASGGTISGSVTDDELVAAIGSAAEGTYVIKAFAQDTAGNWSV